MPPAAKKAADAKPADKATKPADGVTKPDDAAAPEAQTVEVDAPRVGTVDPEATSDIALPALSPADATVRRTPQKGQNEPDDVTVVQGNSNTAAAAPKGFKGHTPYSDDDVAHIS